MKLIYLVLVYTAMVIISLPCDHEKFHLLKQIGLIFPSISTKLKVMALKVQFPCGLMSKLIISWNIILFQ